MNISDQLQFPISPAWFGLSSQLAMVDQAAAGVASMAGDTIIPNSIQASFYKLALANEIQAQKSLIDALSNIAATVSGASGWTTWDIDYLQNLIAKETQTISNNGGISSPDGSSASVTTTTPGGASSEIGSSVTPPLIPVNSATLLSAVVSSMNSANISFHTKTGDSGGDKILDSYETDLKNAVSAFQANPNSLNSQAVVHAEEKCIDRLKYDGASSGSITSVVESVDKAISAAASGAASLIPVDHAALLSDVVSSIDSANSSAHPRTSNDKTRSGYGAALEQAVSSFQANPNDENGQALIKAEEKYINLLQLEHTPAASITSVEDSVDKAIDTTSYGTMKFNNHGPTVAADIGFAVGFAVMMHSYGPLMTPSKVGQSDNVTFTANSGNFAASINGSTVVDLTATGNDSTLGGHETAWDMESPQYDQAVHSQYGELTMSNGAWDQNSPVWAMIEGVGNYLMRQALPNPAQAPEQGEAPIASAIAAGKFTVSDLANAFFGGDLAAEQKIFSAVGSYF